MFSIKNTIFFLSVLIIKFPSSPSSSRTNQPDPFDTTTLLPNFTSQPFPPLFPTPLPPYKPIITTLPNPTDRLQRRTFLCQMFILNQANEAYANRNGFEYRQASQMIQNAMHSQLKQSALKPYLENVNVWYLYNRTPHLAVEFSIILLLPSHTNISATSVRNVFFSILPEIEEQLNGSHIDRNSISVQYLYN
uniref:SEA domain-containing protein n=1 Tax=Elaeophora elaphi TaxID=1147741 RepID=A0A0R3S493_9BILA